MEIVKSKMANALTSADSNHIIAVTADIYDETQGDYQSNINQNLIDEIEDLKSSGGGGGGTPGDLTEYAKITYVDDKFKDAKDYTDEQIGNIDIPELPDLENYATKGYVAQEISKIDIPDTSGLASKQEVADAKSSALEYTNTKIEELNIPTKTSELTNDSGFITEDDIPNIPDVSNFETKDVVAENLAEAKQYTNDKTADLATKEEVESSLNAKQDKTAIVTATNSGSVDKRSVIDVTGNVVISLEPYEQDGYAHSYEIVLNVGDTAYSVAFPSSVKWVKGLEIIPNARYYIVIEDNTAMWTSVIN